MGYNIGYVTAVSSACKTVSKPDLLSTPLGCVFGGALTGSCAVRACVEEVHFAPGARAVRSAPKAGFNQAQEPQRNDAFGGHDDDWTLATAQIPTPEEIEFPALYSGPWERTGHNKTFVAGLSGWEGDDDDEGDDDYDPFAVP